MMIQHRFPPQKPLLHIVITSEKMIRRLSRSFHSIPAPEKGEKQCLQVLSIGGTIILQFCARLSGKEDMYI